MKSFEGTALFTAVLMALGLVTGSGKSLTAAKPAPAEPGKSQASSSAPKAPEAAGAAKAVDLLTLLETECSDIQGRLCALHRGTRLEVTLVGIPDGRDAGISMYRDQALAALRRGARERGLSERKSCLSRGMGLREPECSNEQVEWLFFTGTDKVARLVFLVSESPVLGPERPQLDATLALLEQLEQSPKLALRNSLQVLGPYFSGSARGWREALAGRFRQASFTSGTASADGVPVELHGFSYRGLARPNSEVMCALFEALEKKKANPRVLLLGEDNTDYGRYSCPTAGGREVPAFGYPANIQQLRRAHSASASADVSDPLGLRRTVDFKDEPIAQGSPQGQVWSSAHVVQQNLQIAATFQAICRVRADALLVSATSPLDALFLVEESKKYCPDLPLFVAGAENIFLHPQYQATTDGLMVISDWSFDQMESVMPSSAGFGFYQGWQTILDGEAGPEAKSSSWFGFVSSGAFVPVYRVEAPALSQAGVTSSPPAPREAWHRLVGAVGLLVGGVLLASLALAHWLRHSRYRPQAASALFWLTPASGRGTMPQIRAQVLLLAVLSAGLGCLAWPFWGMSAALPYFGGLMPPWIAGALEGVLKYGLGLEVALGIALCLMSLLDLLRRTSRESAARNLATTVFTIVLLGLVSAWMAGQGRISAPDLFFRRLTGPPGGAPGMPLFWAWLGLAGWSLFRFRQARELESGANPHPLLADPEPNRRGPWAVFQSEKVTATEWTGYLLLAFAVAFGVRRFVATWEGLAYDWLFVVSVCGLATVTVSMLARMVDVGAELQRMLRSLVAYPMIDAYHRVSWKMSGSFGGHFGLRAPEAEELGIARYTVGLLTELAVSEPPSELAQAAAPASALLLKRSATKLALVVERLQAALSSERRTEGPQDERCALYEGSQALFGILESLWRLRPSEVNAKGLSDAIVRGDLLQGGKHGSSPTALILFQTDAHPAAVWMRVAEDFVALRVGTYLAHVVAQLRGLLGICLFGAFLCLASVTAYPFQPGRILRLGCWLEIGVVILGAVLLIVRLEKNEVLSRLSGSQPGRISWNPAFLGRLFSYAFVPSVLVLANIVPELRDKLFFWVAPVLQLLR